MFAIIDDYKDGKIYGANDFHEFQFREETLPFMPAILATAVNREHTADNPIVYKENGMDLLLFYIADNELFQYMADRDATNFIVGV